MNAFAAARDLRSPLRAQSRSMLKFLTKKPSPWAMSNEVT